MHTHRTQFGNAPHANIQLGVGGYGLTEALDAYSAVFDPRAHGRDDESWQDFEAYLDRLTILATGGLPSS